MQLLLRGKAKAIHGVCPAVCPLAKLLGRLGKCHAGRDGAVDDGLNTSRRQRRRRISVKQSQRLNEAVCNVVAGSVQIISLSLELLSGISAIKHCISYH